LLVGIPERYTTMQGNEFLDKVMATLRQLIIIDSQTGLQACIGKCRYGFFKARWLLGRNYRNAISVYCHIASKLLAELVIDLSNKW
jgi:hypothetical protein